MEMEGMLEETTVTSAVLQQFNANMLTVLKASKKELGLRKYDMKNIFIEYMKMVGHPRFDEIARQDIQLLGMSWRSVKNHTGYEMFAMWQLETYMGYEERGWHCGLDESEKIQKGILNKLQIK